ncbi:MAG: hypothetical protein ACXW1T_02750, partial [Methylophilus sp.]
TQFNIKRWLYTTSTLSVLFSWLIFGGMTTLLNPLFSAKAMTNAVLMHANDSTPIAVINTTRGILNYYANRTFSEVKLRDANAWAKAHPDAVLIIKTSDLKAAFPESTIPNSCQVNKTFNMELKEYHVLAKC